MGIKQYLTVSTLLVLLTPYYLYSAYNNLHSLISPLTHASNAALIASTPPSKLIRPLIPPETPFSLTLYISSSKSTITIPVSSPSFRLDSPNPVTILLPTSTANPVKSPASFTSFTDNLEEFGVFVGVYNYFASKPPTPPLSITLSPTNQTFLRTALLSHKPVTLTSEFCFQEHDLCVSEKTLLSAPREYKPAAKTRYLFDTETTKSGTAPDTTPPAVLPHFIPEHSVNVIPDGNSYPPQLASSLSVKRTAGAYIHVPTVYMNNLVQTSDGFVPLIDDPPLTLSITVTSNTSPARHRLMHHLSSTLAAQEDWGFAPEDIDDIRRLITDTSILFLAVTVVASVLHMLFEFLAFKEDISFWSGTTSIRGLSLRSLVSDLFCQIVLALFMTDNGASLLVIVPQVGCICIALFKVKRAFGLRLNMEGWMPRVETNMESADELTLELDKKATKMVALIVGPAAVVYGVYEFGWEEHASVYSFILKVGSAAVYGVGFGMMTPQLFLNYKLQSVAHLPMRVLGYRFVTTFIDDLFACVIRMPLMTRLACFRDDIIFVVYLYQRHIYKVDFSRPSEGGGMVGQGVDAGDVGKGKKVEGKKDK